MPEIMPTLKRSMVSRRFLLSSLALALASLAVHTAPPARADGTTDTSGAAQFLQWLGDQAITTLRSPNMSLEQREAVFRQLLAQGFDIPFIGRFVLGRYWNQATPEQRDEYTRLFGEFLLKTYSRRLGGYAGESFRVVGAKPAGERDALVHTRIERPSGPPLECDWRIRAESNQYKIIDVMVENVSMALTQRQEFTSVVGSSGMDGLLVALRARTDKAAAAGR